MTFSFFEYFFSPFFSSFLSNFPFLSPFFIPFLRLLVKRNIPRPLPVETHVKWATISALAVAFRYSTESYLLFLRRVNSHVLSQVLYQSTSILSILHPAKAKPSQFLGRVGKYPKDVGKNLCYVSYVEIYILFLFCSENITIST